MPLLLFALAWLYGQSAGAEEVLVQAEYSGRYSLLTITAERRLIDQGGGRYTYLQETDNLFGSILERSEFHLDGQYRLVPDSYLYRQSILGRVKGYSLAFDWRTHQAIYSEKDRQHPVALEPGVLDPLLYQLQLQRDLVRNEPSLNYRFLKRDAIKDYTYIRSAQERIGFLDGAHMALRIERDPGDPKRETLIWLSPDNLFQIARITHTENGESNSLTLTRFQASEGFGAWLEDGVMANPARSSDKPKRAANTSETK